MIMGTNQTTSEKTGKQTLSTVFKVESTEETSFEMIIVEGGTFMMGATMEQSDAAFIDEYPTHEVTVSSFFLRHPC